MTTKIVANLIENIIENDDEQAIKDVVRLVCLYLCGTLFFSGLGIQISWSFVQLMKDLPAMSNYNWSQAILDNLRKSVEAYATKPKDVAGCVMLLLLLDGRLQQTEREVRGFRTIHNNQTTSSDHDNSSVNHGSSEHDYSSEHDVAVGRIPENDDEHDNESQDDHHGSNDNDNERESGEDHTSTQKDGEDHGSAEDDDDITNEHRTLLTLVHYYHKTDLKN
ncbi:hypothetical protein RHMOL_Rhmol05G0115700 [Rhododendron molle]|uniref:Uncharacterized protein n=1 Tax=Rhododendron molle TaxID=49168 RepID=A0ACC0NN86_RHOML|nr:hypothetical protein RHMOL_Rhmol05G0115700 [Rhododendron molle]